MITRRLSPKQAKVLLLICKGNKDGSFVDIDQLLEAGFDEHSKQSLQFTLRALIRRGLIQKKPTETRRMRRRVIFAPTSLGYRENRRYCGKGSALAPEDMAELAKLFPSEVV